MIERIVLLFFIKDIGLSSNFVDMLSDSNIDVNDTQLIDVIMKYTIMIMRNMLTARRRGFLLLSGNMSKPLLLYKPMFIKILILFSAIAKLIIIVNTTYINMFVLIVFKNWVELTA